ncbi:hypothetical protein O6H91_01G072100 [Diphasiastrum complanatum]|uniref:Uncharacterized protein n=1 Tax=Diphasiastrum complanatum TaxID=34168 RepID=A0ACC2ESA8_DIPCM|nr:hypothetical protein O6H91_01G072100 [Diphasiastrum complanatum]
MCILELLAQRLIIPPALTAVTVGKTSRQPLLSPLGKTQLVQWINRGIVRLPPGSDHHRSWLWRRNSCVDFRIALSSIPRILVLHWPLRVG